MIRGKHETFFSLFFYTRQNMEGVNCDKFGLELSRQAYIYGQHKIGNDRRW